MRWPGLTGNRWPHFIPEMTHHLMSFADFYFAVTDTLNFCNENEKKKKQKHQIANSLASGFVVENASLYRLDVAQSTTNGNI